MTQLFNNFIDTVTLTCLNMFSLHNMEAIVLILLAAYLAIVAVGAHQFEVLCTSIISIVCDWLELTLNFFLELVS